MQAVDGPKKERVKGAEWQHFNCRKRKMYCSSEASINLITQRQMLPVVALFLKVVFAFSVSSALRVFLTFF